MVRATAWRRGVPAVAGAGQAVLVAGLFLPWLDSGRVRRTSFAAGATLRALGVDGAAGAALRLWPALVALAAVAVALLALGLPRTGLAVAAVVSAVAGTVAAVVVNRPRTGLVHPAQAGPVTTITGAALTLVGVATYFVLNRSSRRPATGSSA